MVIVFRAGTALSEVEAICQNLERCGLAAQFYGDDTQFTATFSGAIPPTLAEQMRANPHVAHVVLPSGEGLLASRHTNAQSTTVAPGGVPIGGGNFAIIAGPCSVEGSRSLLELASAVKVGGALMLRGGAFKPRTSPYAFQGLGAAGLPILLKAKQQTGLPVVSEITAAAQIPLFEQNGIDMLQVGARNMQNYELLRALGRQSLPVLLKRGLSATLDELLLSAEYILAGGNPNVVLCERGIRTFGNNSRNTLDVSAVPLLKQLSHLPVIVDPSHAAGAAELVEPLALAAVAAGADGIMVEVHSAPASALTDGSQSLTPAAFAAMAAKVAAVRSALK